MARFDIRLLGDKELSLTLASLTDQLERKVLSQAIRRVAGIVLADAIARAPTRQVVLPTGLGVRRRRQLMRLARKFARLKNSFKVVALRRRRNRVGYTVQAGTREQLGIVGKYYYPAHVELGHKGPYGRGKPTKAYPYLRPALKTNEARLLAQLGSEIAQGIERELRKL